MKIIALQGRANCGKTTVISKLYHKLCALYERKSYISSNQDGDFTATFNINGKIIGVISLGDRESDLFEPFSFLESYNCELCIICCHKKRVKGGSKLYVERKSKEYGTKIIWYSKAYIEQWNTVYNAGKEIDKINDIQADMLLKEILLQI